MTHYSVIFYSFLPHDRELLSMVNEIVLPI